MIKFGLIAMQTTRRISLDTILTHMELRDLAVKARKRRLKSNRKDNTETPLHSYCFDNIFVLYNLLKERGFNPEIVEGTTEWYAQDLINNGIDLNEIDCVEELSGYVHYWVEVEGKIIDLSCHTEENFGNILISNTLPDSYYRFNDSYKEGKRSLKNASNWICSYCGGKIKDCGCKYEKD